MQSTRLFEITYILLNKKAISARELAAQFGVSTRTIYRDVEALSLAGIPVYTEKGKGGGIRLLPEFVLQKSLLNEQEQNEILSALQGLHAVKAVDAESILQKLSAVFNKNITPWLDVNLIGWSDEAAEMFSLLKYAIFEARIVEFDYYGMEGDMTHRRVESIQLGFKSRAWYLKGYCLVRADIRLFKITRMRRLKITNEHFPPRSLQDEMPLNDQAAEEHLEEIVLKIAPEMTYRVFDEFETAERQPDGSHIVKCRWSQDEWLYGFILSFDEYIEVLAPVSLRDVIKEKARRIQEKYLV